MSVTQVYKRPLRYLVAAIVTARLDTVRTNQAVVQIAGLRAKARR